MLAVHLPEAFQQTAVAPGQWQKLRQYHGVHVDASSCVSETLLPLKSPIHPFDVSTLPNSVLWERPSRPAGLHCSRTEEGRPDAGVAAVVAVNEMASRKGAIDSELLPRRELLVEEEQLQGHSRQEDETEGELGGPSD
jgi:hypothetical protein